MTPRLRARLALLLLAVFAASACRSTIRASGSRPDAEIRDGGRIPAAAFFRHPALSHVVLSPDGKHVAAVLSRDGVEILIARPLVGGETRYLAKLERDGLRRSWAVRRLGWGSNERLLASVEMPDPNAVGVRARRTRLMVIHLDSGHIRYLGEDWPRQEYTQYQDQIVSWLPDDPDHVLIGLWKPGDRGVSACRVDLGSGRLRTVVRARPGVLSWEADHRGVVRFGWGEPRSRTEQFLYARIGPDDDLEEIARFDPYEGDGFEFAGFSPDPAILYVLRDAPDGRAALHTYDLAKRQLGSVVFAHPEVDVTWIDRSPQDDRLLAIGYITDRPRRHVVDEEVGRILAGIDQALPDRTNFLVSSDRIGRFSIVESSGDVAPPSYYVLDREAKTLTLLYDAYPELEGVQLAEMKPIAYPARDGLTIPGYLTLPVDGEPPYPTIVHPHGGPWARDVWGWQPVVQFLASRGFAVLQPNFRGSVGYGRDFERRGYGRWGLEMQDDVADGAQWLVEQGIADPARIGIYGASYGGYTALEALIQDPDLFRAGASFAGVSDLLALLSDDEHYWGVADDMERLVGDRWGDRERLKAVSPARNAGKIRAPVLIAHGTEDPRVHVKQAYAMVDALESAGVPVESHIFEGAVHGFLDERNQIDFFTKLADFFERELGPAEVVATDRGGSAPR